MTDAVAEVSFTASTDCAEIFRPVAGFVFRDMENVAIAGESSPSLNFQAMCTSHAWCAVLWRIQRGAQFDDFPLRS